MMTLLTLTFRHVKRTAALEARLRDSVRRLERLNHEIKHVHLTLEGLAGANQQPARYAVKIQLSVPRAQIHAETPHLVAPRRSDLSTALRTAFDDARRQLQSLRWDH